MNTLGKFCDACQAIPSAGYCGLAACPNVPLSEEAPCTDCGDTGICYQTERTCACRVSSRTLSAAQQVFAQRLAIARGGLEMSQEELSRRSGLPASSKGSRGWLSRLMAWLFPAKPYDLTDLERARSDRAYYHAKWLLAVKRGDTRDQGYWSGKLTGATTRVLKLECKEQRT